MPQTAPPLQDTKSIAGLRAVPKGVKTKSQILKDRARLIAQKVETRAQPGDTITVLEFQLESEKYAINISLIQEVCILKDYARLPGLVTYLMGIMNLRGRIIAIVDLKNLFEMPRKGLAYHNKVIVISNETMIMGLVADEIIGLRSIALKPLQNDLHTLSGKRAEYFAGVTSDWTAILDVGKILADKSLVVNEPFSTNS